MKKKQPTFEEQLARLEDILRALDSGAAPLEETLALYEEGLTLAQNCREVLERAEQKVTVLQQSSAARSAAPDE